jgi:DNA-binding NarL/FixJ family response regulator
MNSTRVALADDDVLLREGLASLLERSGLDVVGQCGDAAQLIKLVRQRRPDLVIVDIRMPPSHSTEGLDAARAIRAEFPETAVLVLSAHVEVEHALDLLASGERSGYLLKGSIFDVAEFVETLQRIVRGASVVDPALVHELVAARRAGDPLGELTTREREVLSLMAEGRTNAGIGHQLWVAEGTVEKHVRSIMMKLQLPETEDDHRRVLAVLAFLDSRLSASGPGRHQVALSWHRPQPTSRWAALRSRPSTAAADSSHLGRNAIAGLAAITSAKSSSARVEIMITWVRRDPRCATSRRARSKPLSSPSTTSTKTTSGPASSVRLMASADVEATPTTTIPPLSRISRAICRKPGLSSTMRQRTPMDTRLPPAWTGRHGS